MLNVIKYYKLWFGFSAVLMLLAVGTLWTYGLELGIDFKGGTLTQVTFNETVPNSNEVKSALAEKGFTDIIVQDAGDRQIIIRTPPQEKADHDKLLQALNDKYVSVTEDQFTSIGPAIGKELTGNAFWQLLLVTLGIIFYIAYAFRKVTRPVSSWRFGWSAIVALVHDLFIVLGIFSLLGHFYGVEIDSLFVTALLTVLGFSVHDTIVVFDRIRENLRLRAGQSLSEIINSSISQTLVRSINTTMTVVYMLTALLIFGGESIRFFVLALLIGIIAGTYSSIFIASPLLLAWHNWDMRRKSR